MLWASITLMTFIDLAGVVGGVCIAILIYKNRTFFRSSGNNGNLLVIAAGALIVAGFLGADFFMILVLPKWIGTREAMSVTEQLHKNVSWIQPERARTGRENKRIGEHRETLPQPCGKRPVGNTHRERRRHTVICKQRLCDDVRL
jgi:hypothetical protein